MSFDDEVTVRYVRYANEQTGWAVLDAAGPDGSPGGARRPTGPPRGGRAGPDRRRLGRRQPLRAPGQGVARRVRCRRRIRRRSSATCAGSSTSAPAAPRSLVARFGPEQVLDVIDSDPEHAFAQVGLRAARAAGGGRVLADAPGDAAAAPDAGPARAGLPGAPDPRALRHRRPPDPHRRPVPADQRVRGRLRHRRPHRAAPRGTPPDPGKRERAAVMHVLAEAERGGSTCLPAPGAAGRGRASCSAARSPRSASTQLVAEGDAVREQEWVYRRATAELEAELAARVDDARRAGRPAPRLARGQAPARPRRHRRARASSPPSSRRRWRRRSSTACR